MMLGKVENNAFSLMETKSRILFSNVFKIGECGNL